MALEEIWRLGADDEDVLLGLVTSGVVDDDGNVLLADHQLAHVLVVSPVGEVVATLGRVGDGPGELRKLHSVFIAGDRVGMVQSFPGKVVYVDREGVPAGGFTLGSEENGGHYSIRRLRSLGTALVGQIERSSNDFGADESVTDAALSVIDLEGDLEAELASHQVSRGIMTIVLDEAAEWSEFAKWAVGPNGVVATIAERDAWAVRERALDGEVLRTLRRPCEARQRSKEEKEEAVSQIRVAVATGRSTFERKALANDPIIVDLQYGRDGTLFVTTCHNATGLLGDGVAGRFDIIAPNGRFVEELTLTCPDFDSAQDALLFLDGTHFLVLLNYEDAQKALHAALLSADEQEAISAAEPLEVVYMRVPE